MYIIRHKITKEQLGKHYSTAATAKGAFKNKGMLPDAGKRRYLKFSEQDIYEVVKEETPEMVALEEAVRLLQEVAGNSTARMCLGDRFEEELDRFLESLDE